MFGETLPETVYIHPMEYNSRRQSSTMAPPPVNNMQCIWIGLAAVVIVCLMNEQSRMRRPVHPMLYPMQHVAGMLTSVVKGVSAKVTRNDGLMDSREKFPNLKGVHLLDDASNSKESVPSEATKRKNHETLLKFVNDSKYKRAVIIIFAHWCPHCHSLINELAAKADSHKGNGVKFLLVNGEAVHSDAFQGENAIVSLDHYPTILVKFGIMGREAPSLDEAVQLASAENAMDEDNDTEDKDTADTDEDDEALKMLF